MRLDSYDIKRNEAFQQQSIDVDRAFAKLMADIAYPSDGESWFVFLDFERPAPRFKQIGISIKAALHGFAKSSPRVRQTISVHPRLSLELLPASPSHGTLFVQGPVNDRDSGAHVVHELVTGANICIERKTRIAENYASRFRSNWLLLVNRLFPSLHHDDIRDARPMLRTAHPFDRILLVPLDQRWPLHDLLIAGSTKNQ